MKNTLLGASLTMLLGLSGSTQDPAQPDFVKMFKALAVALQQRNETTVRELVAPFFVYAEPLGMHDGYSKLLGDEAPKGEIRWIKTTQKDDHAQVLLEHRSVANEPGFFLHVTLRKSQDRWIFSSITALPSADLIEQWLAACRDSGGDKETGNATR